MHVEASYAHDEGEMTLDLLAAHTEGHLTADITSVDWQAWWSSVTSRTQTVWPVLRGGGSDDTGQPVLGLDGRTSLGTRHLGFGKHS